MLSSFVRVHFSCLYFVCPKKHLLPFIRIQRAFVPNFSKNLSVTKILSLLVGIKIAVLTACFETFFDGKKIATVQTDSGIKLAACIQLHFELYWFWNLFAGRLLALLLRLPFPQCLHGGAASGFFASGWHAPRLCRESRTNRRRGRDGAGIAFCCSPFLKDA